MGVDLERVTEPSQVLHLQSLLPSTLTTSMITPFSDTAIVVAGTGEVQAKEPVKMAVTASTAEFG